MPGQLEPGVISCDNPSGHVYGSWMWGEVVCNYCKEPIPLNYPPLYEDEKKPWWKRLFGR